MSSEAKYTLNEKQKALGLPEHALLQDVCTQWNSTFEMMRRLLEQQAAVCAVVIEFEHVDHLPSGDNFKIVENVIEVLKPFKDITETVSGEEYTTVSLVKPLLHHLLTQSLVIQKEDPVCIPRMKTAMKENLKSRYNIPKVNRLLQVVCFLDPRFKRLPFLSSLEQTETHSRGNGCHYI